VAALRNIGFMSHEGPAIERWNRATELARAALSDAPAPVATPDAREAEIETLRARVAALEAAVQDATAYGTTRAVLLSEWSPLVERIQGRLRIALSGGTAALDAAVARAERAEARAERLAGAIRRGIAAFDDGTLTGEQRAASDEMFAAFSDAPAPVATPDARPISFNVAMPRITPEIEAAWAEALATTDARDAEPEIAFQQTSRVVPDARDAEVERLRERVAALEAELSGARRETEVNAWQAVHAFAGHADMLNGIWRERIEALAKAVGDESVDAVVTQALREVSRANGEADAARREGAAKALDDVARRVGALTGYVSNGTALVWQSDVYADT